MAFIGGNEPLLRQVADSKWRLAEPLTYQAKIDRFTVEKDFETDLASVPRALVWLIPRYGRYTKCAILHDWLWSKTSLHKADANGIFRRSMRDERVSLVQRWVMWAAVGLASTLKEPHRIRPGDLPHILGLVLVGVPSAIFVAIPFVMLLLWIGLFYFVDGIGFVIDFLNNKFRPESDREQVNPPNLCWRLS